MWLKKKAIRRRSHAKIFHVMESFRSTVIKPLSVQRWQRREPTDRQTDVDRADDRMIEYKRKTMFLLATLGG